MLRMFTVLCVLILPAPGEIISEFAPGEDGYSGHWGIDVGVTAGTSVVAPVDGEVTFAGSVAGMRTVTIRFGTDMRVSLSYLSAISVAEGERVAVGDRIGLSGRAHGSQSVHLSVRRNAAYIDPQPLLECSAGVIRLLPPR